MLVEKEWLEFGHKFADRCGQGLPTDDANERCPVFLQWLDCVHQLLYQFPCAFQFNEAYLVKSIKLYYNVGCDYYYQNGKTRRYEAFQKSLLLRKVPPYLGLYANLLL